MRFSYYRRSCDRTMSRYVPQASRHNGRRRYKIRVQELVNSAERHGPKSLSDAGGVFAECSRERYQNVAQLVWSDYELK